MKNFLVVVLILGLGVSVYFNVKQSGAKEQPYNKILAAPDSFRINFIQKNETVRTTGGVSQSSIGDDSIVATINIPNIPATSKSKVILPPPKCCPIPPKDTTSSRVINLNKISRIEISPLTTEKL